MGVDAHVTGCSRQGLALAVGNVLLGLRIAVLLSHAEIDDMDDIGGLGAGPTDEEIVGLDIAVYEVLLVDCLDAGELLPLLEHDDRKYQSARGLVPYHLFRNHNHRFDREPPVAVIEQVFQRRAEKIDD